MYMPIHRIAKKKNISLAVALAIIACTTPALSGCLDGGGTTIRISGAWALYPMVLVWKDAYEQTHNVTVEVSGGGAGKGLSDVLNRMVDIGMVSRPFAEEELAQGIFYVAVAKDAVAATINRNNPAVDLIQQQGLSREDLKSIFLGEVTHWGSVMGRDLSDDKIVVLGRSDSSGAAEIWAAFLGNYTQDDLRQKADANYDGDMALAQGVKNQKNAIGFNNINYVYNVETGGFASGIRPIPIDLNGDNVLQQDEEFYDTRSSFVDNVSHGIYPSPPGRSEYLASKGAFTGAAKAFVTWVLTDGQALLSENGYVELPTDILTAEQIYLSQGSRE